MNKDHRLKFGDEPTPVATDQRLEYGLGRRGWRQQLTHNLMSSWQKQLPHPLLKPLGKLYGLVTQTRRGLHQSLGSTRKASRPVISLGNLTVGGTGKTPLALTLACLLLTQGRVPAVLSRGYGRSHKGGRVPLVVSRGSGPEVTVAESGDEAWFMARELEGLRVVVDPCRVRGARVAVEQLGADILILDDGYQHLGLAVDCRILLIPSRNPFGNGAVLPAGPLREPLSAHHLAHILVSVGQAEPTAEVLKLAGTRPVFGAKYKPTAWQPLAGGDLWPLEALRGRRVFAFCGLGRPESFEASLQELGLDLRRLVAFDDHQVYSEALLNDLGLAYLASGAEFLVTTAKDAVKIPPNFSLPIMILNLEMALTRPKDFLETVLGYAEKNF